MFSVIAIIAGLVVLAGCVLDFILRRPSFDDLFGAERPMRVLDCVRFFVLGITLLLPIQKASFLLKIRILGFGCYGLFPGFDSGRIHLRLLDDDTRYFRGRLCVLLSAAGGPVGAG